MAKRKSTKGLTKSGGELRCSGRLNSSCSTSGTRRVFEDTKGVTRIRISKKNRQHNGQKKKYKGIMIYKILLFPVISNEWGKDLMCLRQTEHTHSHLWHLISWRIEYCCKYLVLFWTSHQFVNLFVNTIHKSSTFIINILSSYFWTSFDLQIVL